ncbi:MAG TPA: efflux RND transporter periplasmic adaptor subunit [Gemmatimonadetes bacterium]|nr:efflux RND transporter periplasmic adaptor subunit [Gemmatimonadota bacterium]
MTRTRWLVSGAAVLIVFVGAALGLRKSNGVEYFSAKVERGEIRDAIDASGQVNAVVSVQVGSQVSGTIAKLNADFNSHVRKDEIVALIDPSLFQGALLQANADLAGAKANATAAAANLSKAKSALTQMSADYGRMAELAKERAVSPSEFDLSTANFEAAKASVDAAGAALLQARAQTEQKNAAVSVARTNLAHTVIRSPIDGIVVARNVDVGQTVAASLQAPTIFTIAQDLTKMQLYAKLDESDVGRIKLNQPVTFKVDAFPKETFQGVVSQIRMNPTTVQNVVTYDAIIDFANPDLKVFPGMTAFVTIPVATVDDALKVPNSALRYKPPLSADEIHALYLKYGLQDMSAQTDASGRTQKKGGAELATVWKRHADNSLEPVELTPGITDHAFTQVKSMVKGGLAPGDEVVTGSLAAGASAQGGPPARR